MSSDNINQIEKMFEYNLWANTQLMTICAGLSEEQLQVEVDGVFGRIQPTLVHLVQAEGGYLSRIADARPWSVDLKWDDMTIEQLLEKAQLSGQKLIEVTSQNPGKRHDVEHDGNPYTFFNWTAVLQALYHGIEHRTQIKALLTKLGVPHPDLAAWDYLESLQGEINSAS